MGTRHFECRTFDLSDNSPYISSVILAPEECKKNTQERYEIVKSEPAQSPVRRTFSAGETAGASKNITLITLQLIQHQLILLYHTLTPFATLFPDRLAVLQQAAKKWKHPSLFLPECAMMTLIAQRKRGRSHAGYFRYSGPGDGGPVQFPHGGSGPHRQHGPDAAGRRAGGGQDPSARLLCRDRPRPRHGPRPGGGAAGHEARRPAHSLCLSGGEKAGTDLHHRHCGAAGRPPQHRCYRDLGRRFRHAA